ncbi:MAG: hypothetical protein WCL28_03425 [bacterium]
MNSIIKKMRFLNLIIISLSLVTTSACQRKDSGSGGTVVGNGFIRYHDKTYDFFFDYAKELKISNLSDASIKLDNADYANALSKRVSELTFAVKDLGTSGSDSLLEYASQINGNHDWKPVKNSRTESLYTQNMASGVLHAQYLFRLSRGVVLQVSANAVHEAKGVKLVSSVIASINFDTQSPVIHEVLFEPASVTAGQTAKLKIRATDNMTAIKGTSPAGSVARRAEQTCRQLTTANWNFVDACGEFRSLGNDWYEFDVPTNPKMKPGQYFLYPLTIWDGAGNSMELLPDTIRDVYRSRIATDETLIPMAKLTVQNDRADSQPPSILNARFEPAEITAGESVKLIFEAKDNDPEFSPQSFCERALHDEWFRHMRTDVPKNAEIDPTEYAIHACTRPQKRADGAWEVPVTTYIGLPPGQYSMDLSIKDLVGNISKQKHISLTVTSSQPIDTEGPKIHTIKTDRATYKPGEKGSVLIQATDNLSGVSGQAAYLIRSFCRASMVTNNSVDDDVNMNDRILICDGTLKKIDHEWYALDFQLPDQVPSGEYFLPEISLADNVGNRTFLTSAKNRTSVGNYKDLYNELETNVPVLSVNVTN